MSIVATPSAPPLDIPNYHHTSSSQVNFQQVAGIDGQKGNNEEQLNIKVVIGFSRYRKTPRY